MINIPSQILRLSETAIFPAVHFNEYTDDDYGYKTTYDATFVDDKGNRIKLGKVKILDKTLKYTRLPESFISLPAQYCSLGQSMEYYESLAKLNFDIYEKILKALNDVVFNEAIFNEFKNDEGFHKSLLRTAEAETTFNRARTIFFPEFIQEKLNLKFSFSFKLKGVENKHIIDFDFEKNDYLPFRINTLIGKNGTGKTQTLAYIANALSGIDIENGSFTPKRPLFSQALAISYSPFDRFEKPEDFVGDKFSYHYCGIYGRDNRLVLDDLGRLAVSLQMIHNMKRTKEWLDILNEVIDLQELVIIDKDLQNDTNKIPLPIMEFSSGQNIMLYIATDIIKYIKNDSLLLIDEPETFLHPNAISSLIRMLNKILDKFNSYAIISTHSPQIIQEIPSRYIKVLERNGNYSLVRNLSQECFGENLTNITNEVFGTNDSKSNYKEVLRKLSKKLSYDEVLEIFNNNLSFNARIYLSSLYPVRKNKNS